ncbi:MAG: hypothetical protein BJ554DRAFT_5852 [Olpidium bornovanus]|uniref:Uncharacterized protein n=1 Tax=Olpidium bornovanus TaxID=278681 RepID=A0A8H7ZYW4_9FUNG|nr:MAG: hypothetical protein BJ554DRAFT_5852 [Olpidium bornovanus]
MSRSTNNSSQLPGTRPQPRRPPPPHRLPSAAHACVIPPNPFFFLPAPAHASRLSSLLLARQTYNRCGRTLSSTR